MQLELVLTVRQIYEQAKDAGVDPYQAVADAVGVSRDNAKMLCVPYIYGRAPTKLKDSPNKE